MWRFSARCRRLDRRSDPVRPTAYHPAVEASWPAMDVEGPVRAEVFVVWRNVDHLELTGPCGAAPWIIELDDVQHPLEVVDRIVRDAVGPPRLVHSPSWRRVRGPFFLSFFWFIDAALVGYWQSV